MLRPALLMGLAAWSGTLFADDPPPVGSSPFAPGVQNQVPRGISPFSSGTQNQSPGGYRTMPDTPGVQNNNSWNTGGSGWNLGGGSNWNSGGGGSNWNSGGSNWQPVQPNYNTHQHQYQQPQRYTYTRPQYQSGSTTYPAQPQYSGGYTPSQPQYTPSTPAVTYSGQPIHISMPADQFGSCAYVLASGSDQWDYSMLPGKSQKFAEDRSWQITFDRGGGYGEQSYRLIPGYYRFKQSSRGWELYHSTTAPPPAPTSGFAPPPPN